MLGPDEPRYAAIGDAMARSGDWITPQLWGRPWFEKPPLVYWMTAAADRLGLAGEWAARLPVALVALGFLVFFYWMLRREFGASAAFLATLLCGTSAGWLAYASVGVTDLPMTAALFASILIVMRGADSLSTRGAFTAGILLGLSVLAKGLVPLALFVPAVWLLRRQKRALLIVGAACLLAAGPWYILCTLRNGYAFLHMFFWVQHFERIFSHSLMHVQPSWFYIPVLLAGLFPWTPLLALVFRKSQWADRRLRFLWIWVLFGLLFFSIPVNKLPGYVLPLLPALCAVMGVALDGVPRARAALTLAASLLTLVPVVAGVLPAALLLGIHHSGIWSAHWLAGLPFLAVAGLVWWLEAHRRRAAAVIAIALVAGGSAAFLKWKIYPVLDRQVSVRAFWRDIAPRSQDVCLDESVRRDWVYGLDYYAHAELPSCKQAPKPLVVSREGASGLTLR